MMKRLFILAVVVIFVFACAPRKVTTPSGTEEGVSKGEVTTEAAVPEEEAQKIREQELEGVRMEEVKEPTEAMITEEEKREIFKDIHFDFDRYEIKEEDKDTLRRIADWLIDHPSVKLIIEGHCDERGTNEYNLGLGDRRANATKEYLVSLGVSPARIQTVSYGEERPLCTEHNESCWWKNRRAHFVVIEE
jgi:peptidoglycan-associated lipoprotein